MNNKLKLLMLSLCLTICYNSNNVNAIENSGIRSNDVTTSNNIIIAREVYNELIGIVQQNWIYKTELKDDADFITYCLNNLKESIESNENVNSWKKIITTKIEQMCNQGKILSGQVEVWKVKLNQIRGIGLNTINNNSNIYSNNNNDDNNDKKIGIEVCERLENIVQQHWIERLGLIEDAQYMMKCLSRLKQIILNNEEPYYCKHVIKNKIKKMYRQGKIKKEQVVMLWKIQLKRI